MEEKAIRIFQSCIHRPRKKKIPKEVALTVLHNIEIVLVGLRPGYIVDEIVVECNELHDLVQTLCKEIYQINPDDYAVLSVSNDDWNTLVLVAKDLPQIQSAIKETRSGVFNPEQFSFIQIDEEFSEPCVITDVGTLAKIKNDCEYFLNNIIKNGDNYININLGDDTINMSTMFGILAGYPVVYYYKNVDSKTCLLGKSVNIVKIKTVGKTSKCLFSFSYPIDLEDSLKDFVAKWIEKYKQHSKFKLIQNITIETNSTVLHSVVL